MPKVHSPPYMLEFKETAFLSESSENYFGRKKKIYIYIYIYIHTYIHINPLAPFRGFHQAVGTFFSVLIALGYRS